MKYLLDTHTLLWFLENKPSLSSQAKTLIEDIENEIFVSVSSFFEIAIKVSIGKFEDFGVSLETIIQKTIASDIKILPIVSLHTLSYLNIPLLENHKDPFDRMILAIASSEKMSIITKDEKFDSYKSIVDIVW